MTWTKVSQQRKARWLWRDGVWECKSTVTLDSTDKSWTPSSTDVAEAKNPLHRCTYACFAATFLVFVINLTITLWAWIWIGVDGDGVSTLFRGDCTTAKNLDTLLHVLINIFTTLVLGASNVGLQLVAAPTTAEVSAAHRKGVWLDIGAPSYRNLRNISRGSIVIYYCLAISSTPIHFL